MSGDWQKIGRILKSNGPDGELAVSFPDGIPGQANGKEPVFIEFDGLPVPFFILSIKPRGGKFLVRFNDVLDLGDAEELAGRDLFVPFEEDEYFDEDELPDLEDLVGWSLEDGEGHLLGEISGYEDIPGNPCIYVRTASSETMVPLHEDFILTFDPREKKLRMNLPEGLI